MSQIHEECGLFGISIPRQEDVASCCYYALYALQHRGQASAGITLVREGRMITHKAEGLVNEVFSKETLQEMGLGTQAVSHVRYGTRGTDPRLNAQPVVVNHAKGAMALTHNGALSNAGSLRARLEDEGAIFHSAGDAEILCYLITRHRLLTHTLEEAVSDAMNELQGAYSMLLMSANKVVAVRDPHGFRPLCIGTLGDGFVFASESCALDSIGADFLRDVEPGEIVVVDESGLSSVRTHVGEFPKTTCMYEYIYFARPDSVVDGSSVHIARQRAGSFLALEYPVQADVVIGVPDSGIDAAIGYAKQSGIPYGIGFIKNKYIGRTLIQPDQSDREDLVRIKLNPVSSVVKGKRVVLVDDSIVHGTTSARIVRLLREAGATAVHLRSSAPPFINPCFFGTDVESREELIACRFSVEEIQEFIGVDSLGYLSVENLRRIPDHSKGFCTACFDGNYPCPVEEEEMG